MLQRALLIVLVLSLAACQSGRRPGYSGPIVDTQGVDMARYSADLAECEAYADQVPVAERAATGAAVGAVVTGAIGAVLGNRDTAIRGAGAGAIGGAARGTGSGLHERNVVVHNCLRGRGYRVLN
ncbi:MAG: glycine zipper family protein [Pseudomonadota bacterium]